MAKRRAGVPVEQMGIRERQLDRELVRPAR